MSHWWSPRTWVRLEELKQLEKQAAKLAAAGLPVPPSLSAKIAELSSELSG